AFVVHALSLEFGHWVLLKSRPLKRTLREAEGSNARTRWSGGWGVRRDIERPGCAGLFVMSGHFISVDGKFEFIALAGKTGVHPGAGVSAGIHRPPGRIM